MVQATARLAEQENIRILFEEQEAAYVWADEFKVEEVITNFLSNAMHYAQGEKVSAFFIPERQEYLESVYIIPVNKYRRRISIESGISFIRWIRPEQGNMEEAESGCPL